MRTITIATAVALAVGVALWPAGSGRVTAQQPADSPCGGRSNTPRVPCQSDVDAMMAALPEKAPAQVQKPRKVIVLGRATGYVHAMKPMLEHVLAGIQYALGDLKVDDTPSAKAVSAAAHRR